MDQQTNRNRLVSVTYRDEYCPDCDRQTLHQIVAKDGSTEKFCVPCELRKDAA